MTSLQAALVWRVRRKLLERNMTQRQLAKAVSISEKHMSEMLTGRVAGTIPMWDKILRELGVIL